MPQHVLERLRGSGLRASADLRAEKIGAKIRDAQLEKIPAMLVVGAKEAENQTVSFRDRTAGDLGAIAAGRSRRPACGRKCQPADQAGCSASGCGDDRGAGGGSHVLSGKLVLDTHRAGLRRGVRNLAR